MKDLRVDGPAPAEKRDGAFEIPDEGGGHHSVADQWVDDPEDWGEDDSDVDKARTDEPPGTTTGSADDRYADVKGFEPRDDSSLGRAPAVNPSSDGPRDAERWDPDGDDRVESNVDANMEVVSADRHRFYVIDRPEVPGERTGGYGDALTYRDGGLVRPPLFDGPPRRSDAMQGDLRDCGVIAAMGAVAHHRPDAIMELVTAINDDSVLVRFHEARATRGGVEPTGNRVPLVVTSEVPLSRHVLGAAAFADCYSTGVAWPSMVEKAFAGIDVTRPNQIGERDSGYARLDHGSNVRQWAEFLTQLTGRAADIHTFETSRTGEPPIEQKLRTLLDARCPIIVATPPAGPYGDPPHGLYPLHAYEVANVSDGLVKLHNPWGREHPDPMSVSDLLDNVDRWYAALRPEGEHHDGR